MAKLPKFIPLPSPPQGPLLEEPEEREARMRAYAAQVVKIQFCNLTLLFDYFDIEKTGDAGADFWMLAMCLADKYIPKFSSHAKVGRPRVDFRKLVQLRIDAEQVKLDKNRMQLPDDDIHVVEALKTRFPYNRLWGDYKEKTLRNLLPKARDRKLDILVELFQAHPEAFQPDK